MGLIGLYPVRRSDTMSSKFCESWYVVCGWFGGVRCTAFRVDLGIEELQIHKLKSNNFGYLFFANQKKNQIRVRGAIF